MRIPTPCSLLVSVLCTAALVPALARAAPPNPMAGLVRFAGTVESASAGHFTVKSGESGDITLALPASVRIMVSRRARLADLASGRFVGCTAVGEPGKPLRATECHIFPESMRGMGEGHNPMGPPDTTMTNGDIATMTNGRVSSAGSAKAGVLLHITYQGGAQDIEVTRRTHLTRIAAGDAAMVKPGARVQGAAQKAADGSAVVRFLSVMP
ncbi:MAG TPA: hypothetical protein VMB48_08625 [Steroidobacteraceae bacterium]|nr:hypothetical protein [Steroidobacteraceae bacterium]